MTDLRQIPGSGDAFRGAVEAMKREMPSQLEFIALSAKLRKKMYDSLVEEGFTEAQSLEIVKAWRVGT